MRPGSSGHTIVVVEQASNPMRSFWRTRRGWIAAHIIAGIAAAVIGFAVLLAISVAIFRIPEVSDRRFLVIAFGTMTTAALVALAPLVAYQGWALRRAVAPWAWCLAWAVAILSAPLIVAAMGPIAATASGSHFVYGNAIAGAVLAGLWGAGLQWLVLRGRVPIARWLAAASVGLTLVALAAGSGLVAGLLVAWIVTVPLAVGLLGALTWRSLERLITVL
jgi:hypothetical protein